jgi:hypothetical protein
MDTGAMLAGQARIKSWELWTLDARVAHFGATHEAQATSYRSIASCSIRDSIPEASVRLRCSSRRPVAKEPAILADQKIA